MPALRHPKLEIVAQELAAGRTAAQASAVAGYDMSKSSAKDNARKRAHRKDIRARVAEIRAPVNDRSVYAAQVTAEWALARAYEIANENLGPEATKVGDQINAIKLAMQIRGLLSPDKLALTDAEGNPAAVIVKIISFTGGLSGNNAPKQLAPA